MIGDSMLAGAFLGASIFMWGMWLGHSWGKAQGAKQEAFSTILSLVRDQEAAAAEVRKESLRLRDRIRKLEAELEGLKA